jgi:hypothetical protein
MEDGDGATPPIALRPNGRLPYEKPAVVWEQPLEAQPSLMSGCQKVFSEADCLAVGPAQS